MSYIKKLSTKALREQLSGSQDAHNAEVLDRGAVLAEYESRTMSLSITDVIVALNKADMDLNEDYYVVDLEAVINHLLDADEERFYAKENRLT